MGIFLQENLRVGLQIVPQHLICEYVYMGFVPAGIAWVAAGGAIGAVGRLWVSHAAEAWMPAHPHRATLAVNLVGSLAIGAAAAWLMSKGDPQSSADTPSMSAVRHGLIIGLLGAFTTFSTFSLDALKLVHADKHGAAVGYICLSVVLCIAGAGVGWWVGSRTFEDSAKTTQTALDPAIEDAGID